MVSVEGISSSTENNNGNNIDDVDQISIFDAEKYFSEECNDDDVVSHSKKLSHDLTLPPPAGHGRSSMATPSAPSVASSNNDRQSSSSSSFLTKTSLTKKWSTAKKWLFARNYCCCSNVKSIQVKELKISDSDRSSRPIVLMDSKESNILHADNNHSNDQIQKQKQIITSQILTLSRFSIQDNIVEIHRNIRGTDAAPRQQRISATGRPFISGTVGFTFPISDVAAVAREDDAGSDASSDLFEIETFSTQTILVEDSKSETKFTAATPVPVRGGEGLNRCRWWWRDDENW